MAKAIVNFIGGMMVYFGLTPIIKNYIDMILGKYSQIIYTAELVLRIIMFVAASYI
jgi:hypothetical protein